MLDRTSDIVTVAQDWLIQFEQALARPEGLAALFHQGSHWRDVLALTWDLRTVSGREAILEELTAQAGPVAPTNFRIAPGRTAPRRVKRAGAEAQQPSQCVWSRCRVAGENEAEQGKRELGIDREPGDDPGRRDDLQVRRP